MSFAMSDPVSSVLHDAIDGLALRQRVIADNIANVDTPNYRAQSVDFESALSSAIENGTLDSAAQPQPTVEDTQTPVGANNNNVDLRKESIAAIQTQFQYQIVGRAFTDRFDRLSAAAGSF